MSAKNRFSNFFLFFLILSSLFYTMKVYFFREELNTLFDKQKNEYFEVTNLETFFGLKDSIHHGKLFGGTSTTEYDVPYINIKAEIKNLTNEDIEDAYLYPELKIEFEYGEKNFKPQDTKITFDMKMWESNETLDFNYDFILYDYSNGNDNAYDNKFMKHHPKKIILNLYIKASNSVGLNKDELVYSNELNSWDLN